MYIHVTNVYLSNHIQSVNCCVKSLESDNVFVKKSKRLYRLVKISNCQPIYIFIKKKFLSIKLGFSRH